MAWARLRNLTLCFGLPVACWFGGEWVRGDEPRLNQIQVIGSHNSYHIAAHKTVLELNRGHYRPLKC